MNPTVKAVLLNERATVLSAIAAREGTISDLLVQLNGVENDIWRLRHRLIDLEAYLVGHRVDLPDDVAGPCAAEGSPDTEAPQRPALALQDEDRTGDTLNLPACKPLADFVHPRAAKRKGFADATARHVENA
ncbi:hypothetical protein [Methylobacterium sp. CM6257]|jgi:hypothetical protein